MGELPVIDVGVLERPDPAEWRPVVAAIDQALRTYGFMYIQNHGVPASQMQTVKGLAEQFFGLPRAEKDKINIARWNWHRGWADVGDEQLDAAKPGDLKETFDLGVHLPPDHPDSQRGIVVYGPNQYPDLPGWRAAIDAHFEMMMAVALKMLRALAVALDQPVDFFDRRFQRHVTALRILHYLPARHKVHPDQMGAGAHSDYGCMTLLWQDDVGGLEVQHPDGHWFAAPPITGAFVVNIGDLMARWTNDRYRSTMHRVVGDLTTDRYSIPFFVEPDYDTLVETIPSCLAADGTSNYPPVIAGEYLMSRFDATFAHRQGATAPA